MSDPAEKPIPPPPGADPAALLEYRRHRDRLRKRKARKQQTPAQREHECIRGRERRKRQTQEQREQEKAREAGRVRKKRVWPFMAIDGEGGGTDVLGRQNFLLMVAAGTAGEEYVLHKGGNPLSVCDCLEFILSLPAKPIKVGYGFGYDVTQILRGIDPANWGRILNPAQGKNGPCYTYWGEYAIIYQQGQFLRVARIDRSGPKPAVMKGTSRTIYETLGFSVHVCQSDHRLEYRHRGRARDNHRE